MDYKIAAHIFAELGHPKRLQIVRLLVRSEPKGLTMGQIGKATDTPDSTLTHHIIKLERAKLIFRENEKTSIRCRINVSSLRALSAFLLQECCQNHEQTC